MISNDRIENDILYVDKSYFRKDAEETTFALEEELNIVDQTTFEDALYYLQNN